MTNCVFCEIINKNIDSDALYEDNEIMAIYDINPKAPEHILIIPKKHIESIKTVGEVEKDLLFKIIDAAKIVAEQKKITGYKLIFNVGREGGQVVDHLHLHLLGGWTNKPTIIDI